MSVSGLEAGVVPVVDVLQLARLTEREREAMQLPAMPEWSLYDWKKTDISSGVNVAVTASRQILGGDVRALTGWALAETTGTTAAAIRLHDGNSATGEQFVRVNLAANESNREYFPKYGIQCSTGRVFLEWISGSVEGVIYWI